MTQIQMQTRILGANDLLAVRNRRMFSEAGTLVVNLMSSPGSGKTTLLERTIEGLKGRLQLGVIEGDLYTDQDAQRIENKGVDVVQINTAGTCHLDAAMVEGAWQKLNRKSMQLLVIENVGNLVCPAEFDLGEDFKVVVLSTSEGNDKVCKYPLVFMEARAVVLNKIDLLPYTDFDIARFTSDLNEVNPHAKLFMVSGRTGDGIEKWNEWLMEEVEKKKPSC
ncbi:MAG: hydrogenase nickel incorporation protein HypB [Syntrophomonadaceae bacterium]|jgi:hydrogenase nickel incorporation protein HypB